MPFAIFRVKNPLKLVKMLFALLLSGVIFISTQFGTCIGATDGTPINATRHHYKFDNSGLLIGGYNFDLAHADDAHVSYVKEAGIDFLITSVNENFLNLCDRYGVGIIAKSYRLPSFYYKTYDNTAWLNMTDTTMDGIHECVWGSDMIDEPVNSEFATLNSFAQSYYSKTDGLLPLINLFPLYANSEQLGNTTKHEKLSSYLRDTDFNVSAERYKLHVSDYINNIDTDYISVDIYPFQVGADGKELITNTSWLRNLDILAEACRKTDRDLWVITQAAGQKKENEKSMRYNGTEDIRWQSYVTLSFGAKAIIHACYDSGWWDRDSHLINAAGQRTDTYYAVKTVDAELEPFADIYGDYANKGAFLVNPIGAAGTFGSGYLIPVEPEYRPLVLSSDHVLVGCFEGQNGGRAYTFVNMNEPNTHEGADATVYFDGASEITLYYKGTVSVIKGDTLKLSLASSDGVFVTVK